MVLFLPLVKRGRGKGGVWTGARMTPRGSYAFHNTWSTHNEQKKEMPMCGRGLLAPNKEPRTSTGKQRETELPPCQLIVLATALPDFTNMRHM
eukprot:scaffold302331_cov19-Tisochrysis_lutea.AAC.2